MPVCGGLVQETMEQPQAKLHLWVVVSLPPRNSYWIDKCKFKLSIGQWSCYVKKLLWFNPMQQLSAMQPFLPLQVGWERETEK